MTLMRSSPPSILGTAVLNTRNHPIINDGQVQTSGRTDRQTLQLTPRQTSYEMHLYLTDDHKAQMDGADRRTGQTDGWADRRTGRRTFR